MAEDVRTILTSCPTGVTVVLCAPSAVQLETVLAAGYSLLSLNASLARALLMFPPSERPVHVSDCFTALLERQTTRVLLTDFEMLFDPRYKLDVLKLLCGAARVRALVVAWPGSCEDGRLVYAEPNAPEHRIFQLQNYNVILAK